MKVKKKPVEVEAVKYLGNGDFSTPVPSWVFDAFEDGILRSTDGFDPLTIETLEGPMTCPPGWWIIRGVKQELYACDPEIFAETYKTIEE